MKIVFIGVGFALSATCMDENGNTISTEKPKTDTSRIDLCIQASKIAAPGAEHVLISIGDKETEITNDSVQKAFTLCKDLTPEIVVIPFSIDIISVETLKIIQSISSAGALVCISFDFKFINSHSYKVVSVKEQDDHNSFKNDVVMIKNIFFINKTPYNSIGTQGNDLATAYLAGYFAKIIEFNPLITYSSLIKYYELQSKRIQICSEDKKSFAYYLVPGQHDIEKYYDMISKDYKFYYDDDEKCFRDRSTAKPVVTSQIQELDIVCGDDFAVNKPQIDNQEDLHIHLNYYDNFTYRAPKLEEQSTQLKSFSIPSIYIGSYGMNMEKLELQLYLNWHFLNNNYKIGNISFNPIAHLFGYKYVPFPKESIQYPQYLYDLSQCFYQSTQNKDLIIASMAGTFDRFTSVGQILGDTSHIFMNIHKPDVVILSLSDFLDISEVRMAVNYIQKTIGSKVVIYMSTRSTEDRAYTSGFYNTRLAEADLKAYCVQLKMLAGIIAFNKKDLDSDKLFKHVLKLIPRQKTE